MNKNSKLYVDRLAAVRGISSEEARAILNEQTAKRLDALRAASLERDARVCALMGW